MSVILCKNSVTMNEVLTALKSYCAELGVPRLDVVPDDEGTRRLPLFLRQIYDVFGANLFGRALRLAVVKQKQHLTPGEIEAHSKMLERHLGGPVTFVFDGLASFERNRLLTKGISFIVPHRQMFLTPGIDLREVHSPAKSREPDAPLSMPAQLMLLYHLETPERGNVDFSLYAWAGALGYSKMSISRAHRELVDAGLAESDNPGRSVVLRFQRERRALWERALPLLRSPVVRTENRRKCGVGTPLALNAGLTALSHYSDLAEGRHQTWATSRAGVSIASEEVPFPDEDTVALERWWYSPQVLAKEDPRTVDRLSLYLSLRHDADERVQAALRQLLEGVRW